MKYHNTLDNILGQKSKIRIIRVLADSREELTGREVARLAKLNPSIILISLHSLFRSGIVLMRKSGKAKLYKLNPESILVKEGLLPLFELERSLIKKITIKIKKEIPEIISIILFGSVAKAKEKEDSDIDLLIVLPNNADKGAIEKSIDDLSFDISRSFGNGISPVLLSAAELKKRYKKNDAFIKNIASEGLVLHGKTALEIIYES